MTITYLIPVSGRPNAGKTSLINYLSHSKRPVGKQAGTTLRIASIPLIKNLYLIDLPGYGRITKRSKKVEDKIKNEIISFLEDPSNQLLFPIHIIDISTFHLMVRSLEKKGIIPIDIEMIQFISEISNHHPIVVLSKIDKVKNDLVKQNLLLLQSYDIPESEIFLLSLKTKSGCRTLRNRIKELVVQKLGSPYEHF
ncbi:MAG: 50S ribosome-binding GTPase [Candidatus Heimdallarchaeota archaeon]|nr:MAG: 50S ribosome-binding GTPase [Candidatus Heimdallarchaeota archaeon]